MMKRYLNRSVDWILLVAAGALLKSGVGLMHLYNRDVWGSEPPEPGPHARREPEEHPFRRGKRRGRRRHNGRYRPSYPLEMERPRSLYVEDLDRFSPEPVPDFERGREPPPGWFVDGPGWSPLPRRDTEPDLRR